MHIDIFLRFSTRPGQSIKIFGNSSAWKGNDIIHALPMQYWDLNHWHFKLSLEETELEILKELRYTFVFLTENGESILDWSASRSIFMQDIADGAVILDSWLHMGEYENAYKTVPFKSVFNKGIKADCQIRQKDGDNILFSVEAPLLSPDEHLAISGDDHALGNWGKSGFIPMKFNGESWLATVPIAQPEKTLQYKYCITDQSGKLIRYEDGENRMLKLPQIGQKVFVRDNYANFNIHWRGTGVAVPVFSLRSGNGLGVGEFTDIKLLVDWAKSVDVKMIQLLPVNDTTSTHTKADSYPYAAISAFALHPLYASIDTIAGKKYNKYVKDQLSKATALNASTGVAYEEVMALKWQSLSILYDLMGAETFKSADYKAFFKENKDWLVPYAAYSYLRDTFGTPDSSKWGSYEVFNDAVMHEICAPDTTHFTKVALHYFIQYHLHVQLREAHQYANTHGVILKGDIAIGVHRHGADTWTQSSLYNLDKQAGAPPDDFAVKGQNWGFPTYNWQVMKADGFAWWKQRFQQMSNYFDAFRIDHILGFFRIWSIPDHAVEGIMGKFIPAIPVFKHEMENRGVHFNRDRFCTPYITDQVIWEMAAHLDQKIKSFLQHTDIGRYRFRDEYNSQRKLENHFSCQEETPDMLELKQALFDLHANVILWDDDHQPDAYHFRFNIAKTISFQHLSAHEKQHLLELYNDYYFNRQDEIWRKEALDKLPALKRCTEMLICGEDLGLVPKTVPEVMSNLGFLSMEVQRMPKKLNQAFFDPYTAPFLAVVTPSTHDMSTIREWWLEDKKQSQRFYNELLWQHGEAPEHASCHIVRAIILQHLSSPAMWSVFQLQDLFAMRDELRLEDPSAERINVPGDPKHFWRFRMHIPLEELIKNDTFNTELKTYINSCGR